MLQYELQKGINLNIIKTTKFKTICIVILFKQKLDKKYATFNALLPTILYKGCQKYNSINKIFTETEEMFGASFYTDIMKKGDNQLIEFLIEFVPEFVDLSQIVDFLNEVILHPLVQDNSFKSEYFQISKQELIDTIKNRINDKKEFSKIRTVEEMFSNEDFGISADGYLEDLENDFINEKTLFQHYKKVLQESEINIISIGNIQEEVFTDIIKKNFVDFIQNRNFVDTKYDEVLKTQSEPNFISEKFNVSQGKLCIGFRTNILPSNELFFALLVGNEILGGGAGSKLFINLREKESLCYYINSFIFLFKGVIFVQSGIDFNQFDNVVSSIQKQINNIKNGEFEQIDINNAIINLEKTYISILDYNISTMDFYLTNLLAKIPYNIEEFVQKIKNVKKEDIIKAFENIWMDTCYFMKGE